MNKLPYKENFLLSLRSSNYSSKTVKSYDRDLLYFESFLVYSHYQFEQIKRINIDEFKAILRSEEHIKLLDYVLENWTNSKKERKNKEIITEDTIHQTTVDELSASSINRMLSALRSYLKFLEEYDHTPPITSNSVKLLKKEKKETQLAEKDELFKLIECPIEFEKNEEIGVRNRAILELLFSTGMRISEIVRLNRDQLSLGKPSKDDPVQVSRIYILGKGKKQRFVYLTERSKEWLEKYLKYREDDFTALFIIYKNKKRKDNLKGDRYRLTVDYIQKKIVEYRTRLGIIVPTSAHSLRHGFATYLIENGANTAAVQTLLGHESLATTTRYVHTSDKFAEDAHKNFHPAKK